jgi:hypothetical protein
MLQSRNASLLLTDSDFSFAHKRCNSNSGNERVGHSSSAARTFDLALQSWRNHDLPQHLRWSGKHSDIGFLIQSGVLEGIASQFQVSGDYIDRFRRRRLISRFCMLGAPTPPVVAYRFAAT